VRSACSHTCRWCGKTLRTQRGLESHLLQTRACHRRVTAPHRHPVDAQSLDANETEIDILDLGNDNIGDANPPHPEMSSYPEDPHDDDPVRADNNDNIDRSAAPLNPRPLQYAVRQLDADSQPRIYEQGHTRWEELKSNEDPANPFYPWESKTEFELVKWLSTTPHSQASIDDFLRLNWVCNSIRSYS